MMVFIPELYWLWYHAGFRFLRKEQQQLAE
jgi:hypothetical protein